MASSPLQRMARRAAREREEALERCDLCSAPMGAAESLLGLEAWRSLEAANPVLATLEPDVEALLVNRARGERRHHLVPISDCYELAGLIRTRWRGLTGGREVWEEIGRFFEELDRRSRPASAHDDEEATWRR